MNGPEDRRSILSEMQVSLDELAGRVGMASQSVSRVLSGKSKSKRARAKIEAALGEPIWCSWDEFLERGKIAEALEGEPEALTVRELRARARHGAALERFILDQCARHDPKVYKCMTLRIRRLYAKGVKYDRSRRAKQQLIEDIVQAARNTPRETLEALADLQCGKLIQGCRACGAVFRLPDSNPVLEKCPKCRSVRIALASIHAHRDSPSYPWMPMPRRPRAKAPQSMCKRPI